MLPVVADYQASTLNEVYAVIDVDEFQYTPPKDLTESQLQLSFMILELNHPVQDIYADAVRRELTHAGSDVFNKGACRLSGEIINFNLDTPDALTVATPVVTVRYILIDALESKELFVETIDNEPHQEDIFDAIHRNIDALLSLDKFVQIAEEKCAKN